MEEVQAPEYSDDNFWDKLKRYALVAGKPVVEKALELFYTMQSAKTPMWAKTIIIGALVYFINPIDAIPDVIPLAGYTDDLGALAAAAASVGMFINDDIKKTAAAKLAQWFGK